MTDNSQIYYFEQGIPGFEHLHQFEFTKIGDDLPMQLMKSVEDENISLLVASPFLFYQEYEWELSESAKDELSIKDESDIEVWSVVTVPADPTNATLNLLAPLVLNKNKKVGKQLILHDSNYSSRTPLIRA